MKRILSFLLTAATILVTAGCFDDSKLWDELKSQKSELEDYARRIASLEQQCAQMNTNISSIQSILAALQNNDYVTGVTNVMQGGEVVGYTISFSKSASITIYHGQDGTPGADGKDGADGTNGTDGTTPIIGVRADTDGLFYWTLNGEWLLDSSGKKVLAQGRDGRDGADGRAPQLKVEDGFWFVSYDGSAWTKLGKAQGEQGPQGDPGPQGPAGVGTSGDSMFASVDTSNPDFVMFTLSSGTTIKLPTWSAFESLRTACNKLNTNVEALHAIVTALQDKVFVTAVVPVMENGKKVGYSILFSSGEPVTIYNGQDGKDGVDGASGTTPVIGVGDFEGALYWTVNGEWLLNGGEKVKAEGRDGQDGSSGPGSAGQDGVTPMLRINPSTNYWEVSYDNGSNWESLGVKATGERGPQGDPGPSGPAGGDADCVFSNVILDEGSVTFVLADGTAFTLPMGVPVPAVTDLSAGGTANCYIVTKAGKYSFTTVKGNSTSSVSPISSVEVLWESFGTDTAPEVGDLVSEVAYSDNSISFTASDKKGNAVIAAKDGSGNILWSWHIWMTDRPADIICMGDAGTTMDRNLGATSATPGDFKSSGLLYQWGRKDPFLGKKGLRVDSIKDRAVSTNNSSWAVVASDASTGTLGYAAAHPTTFISMNSLNRDWLYTGSDATYDTRWTSTKMGYDPCPPGYRVPDGGPDGIWSKAIGSPNQYYYSGVYDFTNNGVDFARIAATMTPCWYPTTGVITSSGNLDGGGYGYYWSCTPYYFLAYSMSFSDFSISPSSEENYRGTGMAVRCQKE